MKISQILSSRRHTVSFEIFPPKRGMVLDRAKETIEKIAATKPAFMSVTYGAGGGSTGVNTCELSSHVQNVCGVPALAHLTCITSTREMIAEELKAFRRAGIENILCLRGDFPPDFAGEKRSGGFSHAIDLIKELRPSGFCLGGACYPEGHPESANLAADIAYLKEKTDAGLDFLTTQMFFDNNVYFRYLSRLRNAGITVPVIAGIMPVTNAVQIKRVCQLSGTYLPPRFRAIVDHFGENPMAMEEAGVAYATEQIFDLFANGADNVHVYTMNKPQIAEKIMANLSNALG